MKQSEIRPFLKKHQITTVELSATIGLPASYLDKIENQEVPALDSDMARIEAGLRMILQNRALDSE